MSDDDIERLCAGYRATVEDPPSDVNDAALLHAAAKLARTRPSRRLAYAFAAGLLAALAVAAGLRVVTAERDHVEAHPEAPQAFNHHTTHFDSYLTNATLSSVPRQRFLQPRDPQVLLKTAALAPIPSGLGCGTAAAVDLNAPGAFAGLKASRPGAYAKIIRIIAGVTRHPERDVARWISTTFHAEYVSYFPLWLTSLPPRRRLSFCLQGARYDVVLTIARDGARVSPADYPRKP